MLERGDALDAAVPRIVQDKSSEKLTALEGSDLTLECAAEGFPVPQINWEKYGGQLPVGRYSIVLGLNALNTNIYFISMVNLFCHGFT